VLTVTLTTFILDCFSQAYVFQYWFLQTPFLSVLGLYLMHIIGEKVLKLQSIYFILMQFPFVSERGHYLTIY